MTVASSYRFDPPPPRPRKKRTVVRRDREGGAERLHRDYFSVEPVYGPQIFRRRFRMSRELFLRIVNALEVDPYFQQRPDAIGRLSFSPIQKCTAAVRQLAYGTAADCCDEYLRIGETTALECLKKFCKAVVRIFGGTYLRWPTTADVQRIIAMHEARHGFPGMLGSLDCMHWGWKNCPVAWHSAYTRGDQVAGSNNNINVLHQSTLFNDVLAGHEAAVHFLANNSHHTQGYYLTDGIYPDWPVFVKSFQFSNDEKKQRFKVMQEAARKDVERAFGVLQARWGGNASNFDGDDGEGPSSTPQTQFNSGAPPEFAAYLARNASLKDARLHARLRDDLVEHICARFGPVDP
ncbi:uncharacterized protein LOC131023382 [Salvia miltiorrhiza]|uniref:uncharacterized protein LOC131023382 n=1 Tax=Salvia miltiorrhiza TaxID=226208 RepID=UPI0025AD6F0E|nr:uncharacterized protein LOC131023382 [Salvia miltiorrhiza]